MCSPFAPKYKPGRVAQLGHLTRKSEVLGSNPGLATYFRFSFRWFKKGSCQLAKVCALSMVNRLGGLSLPRNSVVRLTDHPDTLTVNVKHQINQPTKSKVQTQFCLVSQNKQINKQINENSQ